MRGNTGDSYAIAARAGAELVDMEQVQFLPFCLASPPSYEGLLAGEPVTASFLGVLRDKNGKVILDGVYLRTRAECSAAIMRAVEDGRGSPNGGAYLDMTGNKMPPRSGPYFMKFLESALPSAYRNARQALGKAAASCEEAWEVRPSAHYMMGGIRTDERGASVGGEATGERARGVKGLFAAGQAMGGVFGANRLGSTSLTEGAVFGARAGLAAAEYARINKKPVHKTLFAPFIDRVSARFGQKGKHVATVLKHELQNACWENIGPVRTAERIERMNLMLERVETKLDSVSIPSYSEWNQSFIEFAELRNLIAVAKMVSMAALERDGSLGGHVRLDRRSISPLSTPYSTVIKSSSSGFKVRRVARERTPFGTLLTYKIKENWRKVQVKALRMLPVSLQDRRLEKKYKTIMGGGGKTPELTPGSVDAAIGEATEL